jgi:hypothetical protein
MIKLNFSKFYFIWIVSIIVELIYALKNVQCDCDLDWNMAAFIKKIKRSIRVGVLGCGLGVASPLTDTSAGAHQYDLLGADALTLY